MDLFIFMYRFLLLAIILLAGCHSNDCGFPLDQIRYSDKAQHNKKTFYLYTRTTGWHNKVVFFELYDSEPTFDNCRQTKTKFIYKIDYDNYPEHKYVKKIILQPENTEKLKIIYTTNKEEGFPNIYDVKFSR